ncbi:putative spore germination protein YfkR [Paenibacillus agaridevorans]|uniref:Putative spore germination protein YfkR n=1 Tax=Paenibacillus agaridevorans TaxID=171404 RepID=A0A2R5EM70_9BACL|nr:Ger(x)C family spore germination protein [Paenibacillus agaridevorans]GBG07760.1 putative spore germination protein YfkR [Paenibacillus agaridevorans]
MKPIHFRIPILLLLLLLLLLTTGCWDRKELDDQAIITAWGFDLIEDEMYTGTAQFAIPSKLGVGEGKSQDKAFFTISGNGKNMYDASKNMRLKLSRPWFEGHSGVVLIGERLAKHGLANILDELGRDPTVRLRRDIIVLRGGSVQDFLELTYPLESLSAHAIVSMHETAGLNANHTLRNFYMAAESEESSPFLPVIEMTDRSSEESSKLTDPKMKLWGFAIFNKDSQLVGYLPMNKGYYQQWVKGLLKSIIVTVDIPGEKGNVVVEANHLKSKIVASPRGTKVHFNVTLSGKGNIRENNTRLDLGVSKNIALVQNELHTQVGTYVHQIIKKVQPLGTDIFGFGEAFHRQHPYQWNMLKKEWPEKFAEAEVSVSMNLQIQETGLTGAPYILKNREIKK